MAFASDLKFSDFSIIVFLTLQRTVLQEKSSISHGVQERGTDTTKATLKVPTKSRKSRSK